MPEWQPTRLAAVLAAAEQAGLTKSDVARIARVHRSQVSRWFNGYQRPGYDAAMRVAGYLEKEQPALAAEFTAAAGYSGPVEPGPQPLIPPGWRAIIARKPAAERHLWEQAALEFLGELQVPEDAGEDRSQRGRQAG
jgi:transcriptional regulator with XRE-family HTH domain